MRDTLVEDVFIVYIPKFREYGIRILDGGTSFKIMEFCPWCGIRLPASLRDMWFAQLDHLGLEPESKSLPLHFRTDAWWNKSAD
jgi:hypothetical protein